MMAMVSILNPTKVNTLLNVSNFLVVFWSLKELKHSGDSYMLLIV
jgi:hypothetical protein